MRTKTSKRRTTKTKDDRRETEERRQRRTGHQGWRGVAAHMSKGHVLRPIFQGERRNSMEIQAPLFLSNSRRTATTAAAAIVEIKMLCILNDVLAIFRISTMVDPQTPLGGRFPGGVLLGGVILGGVPHRRGGGVQIIRRPPVFAFAGATFMRAPVFRMPAGRPDRLCRDIMAGPHTHTHAHSQ